MTQKKEAIILILSLASSFPLTGCKLLSLTSSSESRWSSTSTSSDADEGASRSYNTELEIRNVSMSGSMGNVQSFDTQADAARFDNTSVTTLNNLNLVGRNSDYEVMNGVQINGDIDGLAANRVYLAQREDGSGFQTDNTRASGVEFEVLGCSGLASEGGGYSYDEYAYEVEYRVSVEFTNTLNQRVKTVSYRAFFRSGDVVVGSFDVCRSHADF